MTSSTKVLAQSQHYSVTSEYETVFLTGPDEREFIGDLYGDPKAAVIDWEEQWCVTVGAGLVVYYLREDFHTYTNSTATNQRFALFQGSAASTWWIEAVYQVTDTAIRFVVDPYSTQAGVYELQLSTLTLQRLIPREENE